MPRKVTYQCKLCETERKESNNWFVSQGTKTGYNLITWDQAVAEGILNDDTTEYICGHRCAHALLDQFLSGKHKEQA